MDCLIKPVLFMMMFVRAEREGDWALHLCTVSAMMPYFFAAGHINYARCELYYMRSLEALPHAVLPSFLGGQHVMRHQPGLWNGMWSDMFIETTLMRYGHGPGGLVGITLNESALKRWALSLHVCSRLIKDIADMRDEDTETQVLSHKGKMPAHVKSDVQDRENIRDKLKSCIDPLNEEDHPDSIVNIVTGRISKDTVNVDQAVIVGREQMETYEASWPDGFYGSLTKKLTTMADSKKCVKVGPGISFDTDLIYSRVMCFLNSRDIDLLHLPTSIFDDSGDMRITKTKSTLKRKLQVELSARHIQ